MCGQAGIIFGTKRRTPEERKHLADIFTQLLLLNQERGPFATGVALVNRDGTYQVHKEPLPAHKFVQEKTYQEILYNITDEATILMGHTRWPTHGSVLNNTNNHPIVVGTNGRKVIGTHNGAISNADALFRHFEFTRIGQVDSEILFRMADSSIRKGRFHVPTLLDYFDLCRGQMSTVTVTTTDPGMVFIVKGNKPLELCYHREYQTIAYASDPSYLVETLEKDPNWDGIPTQYMKLMVFRCNKLSLHVWKQYFLLGNLSHAPLQKS
jgi:glucosamine 6-phosphate synthetase-like amidotransferase/phosphosugar isomerase protein